MADAKKKGPIEQQWMHDFVERYDRETTDPSWILQSRPSDRYGADDRVEVLSESSPESLSR